MVRRVRPGRAGDLQQAASASAAGAGKQRRRAACSGRAAARPGRRSRPGPGLSSAQVTGGDLRRRLGDQLPQLGLPAGLEAGVGHGDGHGGQRSAVAVQHGGGDGTDTRPVLVVVDGVPTLSDAVELCAQLRGVGDGLLAVALQSACRELVDLGSREMGEDGVPGGGGVQRGGVADGVEGPYGVVAVDPVDDDAECSDARRSLSARRTKRRAGVQPLNESRSTAANASR